MKKILVFNLMLFCSVVIACPKGQRLHGGAGSHHKYGYCSY